jgi:hypothetical protein
MFVGSEGKPTRRHGVPWSDPPLATASTSPYVLAVLPRHIEVRSTQSLAAHTLVQTVPLRGMTTLATPLSPAVPLAPLYVASATAIHRLMPVALHTQVGPNLSPYPARECVLAPHAE